MNTTTYPLRDKVCELNRLHALRSTLLERYPGYVFAPYVYAHCQDLYERELSDRQWRNWLRTTQAHLDRKDDRIPYRHLSVASTILLSALAEKRRGNKAHAKVRHFTRAQLITFVEQGLAKDEWQGLSLPAHFEQRTDITGAEIRDRLTDQFGCIFERTKLWRAGLRIRHKHYSNADYQRFVVTLIGA